MPLPFTKCFSSYSGYYITPKLQRNQYVVHIYSPSYTDLSSSPKGSHAATNGPRLEHLHDAQPDRLPQHP